MTMLDEATTTRSTLILVVIDNKDYMSVPKTARERTWSILGKDKRKDKFTNFREKQKQVDKDSSPL